MPISITESNGQGTQAVVGFAYDNRGRLIGETRTGATPYDLEYAYDQAGNRTSKLDNVASLLTLYEYDVDDPVTYQSDNNRLMKSEMYDVSGTPVLVETKWYTYVDQNGYDEGCVNRIVTRDHTLPGAPHYSAVRMEYDKALRVSFMLGEEWDEDGGDPDSCPDNFVTTWAREFRYDAARARYLNRELDPTVFVTLSETWTDYDTGSFGGGTFGDESYGDFEIDAGAPPTIDNLRSFEPGVSAKNPDDQSSGVSYYHSDLIGTTRTMSNSAGAASSAVAYTAFGEKITTGYTRYGYAGSWGYQAHDFPSGEGIDAVPFMHVGWRHYDPSTGRFLQRDPIGIRGGWNVYGYVALKPTVHTDPLGLAAECQFGCAQAPKAFPPAAPPPAPPAAPAPAGPTISVGMEGWNPTWNVTAPPSWWDAQMAALRSGISCFFSGLSWSTYGPEKGDLKPSICHYVHDCDW